MARTPDDDLPDRSDRLGQPLLADVGDQPVVAALLGGEVEEMAGHPLADRREDAAGDLRHEVDDSLAERQGPGRDRGRIDT